MMSSPITRPLLSDADIDSVIPDYFDSKRSSKQYHKISPNLTTSGSNIKQIHVSKKLRIIHYYQNQLNYLNVMF